MIKISNEQIGAIWLYLGRPDKFIVVDLRPEPCVFLVAYRSWAEGGFSRGLLEVLAGNDKEIARQLMRYLASRRNIKAACLLEEGRAADIAQCVLEQEFMNLPEMINVHGSDLFHEGKKLRPSNTPARTLSTVITVRGYSSRDYSHIDLPLKVKLDLSQAKGMERHIGIEGQSIHGTGVPPFPPAAWFKMPEGIEAAELTVGIMVDTEKDSWNVALTQFGKPLMVIEPLGSSWQREHPTRLTVLFDRTCPDEDRWKDAFYLSIGRVNDSDYHKTTAAEPANIQDAINHQIREGLAGALGAALSEKDVVVEIFWFADTADKDMAIPEGLDLARDRTGHEANVDPPITVEKLKHAFGPLGYSPGLDIWDHLDTALIRALREEGSGRRAILIVGNSPPGYPAEKNSPLLRIAQNPKSRTSYRRLSGDWASALDECRKKGIPVVYLFLKNEGRGVEERYRALQTEVRLALEECVQLVAVRANTEEINHGVRAAMEKLTNPANPGSQVRVLE